MKNKICTMILFALGGVALLIILIPVWWVLS